MVELLPLLGLDVPEKTLVDASHAEEKRLFEVMLEGDDYPWQGDYLALLNEGWYWRDACYIAWKGTPKPYRQPDNLDGLAALMGFSRRTLTARLAKNPTIRVRAAKQVAARAFDVVDEVWDALIESASDPNYKSHPDRKLFMEMTGQYTPKQAIGLGLETDDEEDLSKLTKEELARLAGMGGNGDE
jgi:hypothetical protein